MSLDRHDKLCGYQKAMLIPLCNITAIVHESDKLFILVGYINWEVTLQQLDYSLLICIRDRNLIVHVINRYENDFTRLEQAKI